MSAEQSYAMHNKITLWNAQKFLTRICKKFFSASENRTFRARAAQCAALTTWLYRWVNSRHSSSHYNVTLKESWLRIWLFPLTPAYIPIETNWASRRYLTCEKSRMEWQNLDLIIKSHQWRYQHNAPSGTGLYIDNICSDILHRWFNPRIRQKGLKHRRCELMFKLEPRNNFQSWKALQRFILKE